MDISFVGKKNLLVYRSSLVSIIFTVIVIIIIEIFKPVLQKDNPVVKAFNFESLSWVGTPLWQLKFWQLFVITGPYTWSGTWSQPNKYVPGIVLILAKDISLLV